jgi:leucyl/phenylalanyl-tRNA--protein transferase
MPVYRLGRSIAFPPPEHAVPEGLVAFGGDLSIERLLAAYREGIFPWYDRPPILWWCPDPRLVLYAAELKVSRSLRTTIRKGIFETRVDTAFAEVIEACASVPRAHEKGTWINRDMQRAYVALHQAGYAHSIESWREGELLGGLYGVCVGRAFFGESMFSRRADASKVALVGLVAECQRREISIIDCQVSTRHLVSLGACEISRDQFLLEVRKLVREPLAAGRWSAGQRRSSTGNSHA